MQGCPMIVQGYQWQPMQFGLVRFAGGFDRSAIQNTQFYAAVANPALGGCVVSDGLRFAVTFCRQVGGIRTVGNQVIQNRIGTTF